MIKDLIRTIFKKNMNANNIPLEEFCPRCKASLTMQKGYSNELPYWVCKGCGEMLINPEVDTEDNIVWVCDKCGSMLNIQNGFSTDCGKWTCTECGFINKINAGEIYATEDEFQASKNNPYKGLSDEDVLELSSYYELETIGGRENVILVCKIDDNTKYVKKYLKEYDLSIYEYVKEHPIEYMPRIYGLYEGTNNLVVIEEYINGNTIQEIKDSHLLAGNSGIAVAMNVCKILCSLHNLEKPIIHRDIKPSNIIMSLDDGHLYLLDMNVAKWYKPDETEDTKLFATQYYAAPEQFGYGFSASSTKTDIYAVGILLNVLLTGKVPKEQKAEGPVWPVIEKCISLNPDERYTAEELLKELTNIIKETS